MRCDVVRCSRRKAMDEQEFDSLRQWQLFGTENAKQGDLRFRRTKALAARLWSRATEDLERQLLAPRPEIPSGFDLADFRELEQMTRRLVVVMKDPQNELLARRIAFASGMLVVGQIRYAVWEARWEIVRRAVEHLESR
jgi:hypothetical protein